MAVRPQDLETPERDLDLTTRGPGVTVEAEDAAEEPKFEDPTLAARIAAVRALSPPDVACRACWTHGRDAALRTVAGAGIEAARAILPTGSERHDLGIWAQGRDVAIKAIEGE